jgi:hypothetical protein
MAHILVACGAWAESRSRILGEVLEVATAALEKKLAAAGEDEVVEVAVGEPEAYSEDDVASLLLGGESRGIAIPEWGGPDKKKKKSERKRQGREGEEAKRAEPPCAKVGIFLCEIERRRKAVFDKLSKEFARDQGGAGGPPAGVAAAGAVDERGDGAIADDDIPPRGDAHQGMPGLFPAHAPVQNGD